MGGIITQIACECGCLEFYIEKDRDDEFETTDSMSIYAECTRCGRKVTLISITIG